MLLSRSLSSLALIVLIGAATGPSLLAQAPADSAAAPDSIAMPATPPAKPDPTRITAADIAASRVATAYEAVDRLHHPWFKDRLTGQEVTVYTDGNRSLGGAESLRRIPAANIVELRYLDGRTAVTRWPEAGGGAIVVVQH